MVEPEASDGDRRSFALSAEREMTVPSAAAFKQHSRARDPAQPRAAVTGIVHPVVTAGPGRIQRALFFSGDRCESGPVPALPNSNAVATVS